MAAGGLLLAWMNRRRQTIRIISTAAASPPAGHYSQATAFNGTLHVSGLLPVMPDGTKLAEKSFEMQATQVLENLRAVLEASGSAPSKLISCRVYVRGSAPVFSERLIFNRRRCRSRTLTTGSRSIKCTRHFAATTNQLAPSCPCRTCITAWRSNSRPSPSSKDPLDSPCVETNSRPSPLQVEGEGARCLDRDARRRRTSTTDPGLQRESRDGARRPRLRPFGDTARGLSRERSSLSRDPAGARPLGSDVSSIVRTGGARAGSARRGRGW